MPTTNAEYSSGSLVHLATAVKNGKHFEYCSLDETSIILYTTEGSQPEKQIEC